MPRHLVALVLTFCASSACKASFPYVPTAPTGTVDLQLLYPSSRPSPHRIGDLFNLTAVTSDTDYTYRAVTSAATWSSSDPSVAEVSPGLVRIVGNGLAQVTATYQGLTASLLLPVSPPPHFPFITINTVAVPRIAGDSGTARANLSTGETNVANDVTALATWTSSDPQIATVSQGLVRALRIGTVEISVVYAGATGAFRFSVHPAG